MTCAPPTDRPTTDRERGAAAVEFALILPLLVMLVFGIIEFGRGYNAKIELTGAVREGARELALGKTSTQAQTTVRDAAPTLTNITFSGHHALHLRGGRHRSDHRHLHHRLQHPVRRLRVLAHHRHGGHAMRRVNATSAAPPPSSSPSAHRAARHGRARRRRRRPVPGAPGAPVRGRRRRPRRGQGLRHAAAPPARRRSPRRPHPTPTPTPTTAGPTSTTICGNVSGLAACTARPTVPTGARYVQVTTSTVDGDYGATEVSFGLARALGDDRRTGARLDGRRVGAARRRDHHPAHVLALRVQRRHEQRHHLRHRAALGRASSTTSTSTAERRRVRARPGRPAATSPAGSGGSTTATARSTSTPATGSTTTPATTCRRLLRPRRRWRDKVLLIPIFAQTNGLNGNNGEYRIAGFAAFHITGYRFPGNASTNRWPNTFTCPRSPATAGSASGGTSRSSSPVARSAAAPPSAPSAIRIVG